MPVARVATANDRAVQDIQRGKQTGGAVAFVVLCHGSAPAFFHRQTRLGPVQGLHLRFLIDAQNQRFGRGIEVEANDVVELFHKLFVPRQFESPNPVRLQPVRFPYPRHRHVTDLEFPGQRACAPMRRIRGRRVQGGFDNAFDQFVLGPAGAATMRRILGNSRTPLDLKTVAPQNHGGTRCLKLPGNDLVGFALGREQANPGRRTIFCGVLGA